MAKRAAAAPAGSSAAKRPKTVKGQRQILKGKCVDWTWLSTTEMVLKRVLQFQGWQDVFTARQDDHVVEEGVRQLYESLRVSFSPEQDQVSAVINKKGVHFSTRDMALALFVPHGGFCTFAKSLVNIGDVGGPEIIKALFGGGPVVKRSMRDLRPELRVLVKFIQTTISPRNGEFEKVLFPDMQMAYALLTDVKVSLPRYMMQVMVACSKGRMNFYPYGRLLTTVLENVGADMGEFGFAKPNYQETFNPTSLRRMGLQWDSNLKELVEMEKRPAAADEESPVKEKAVSEVESPIKRKGKKKAVAEIVAPPVAAVEEEAEEEAEEAGFSLIRRRRIIIMEMSDEDVLSRLPSPIPVEIEEVLALPGPQVADEAVEASSPVASPVSIPLRKRMAARFSVSPEEQVEEAAVEVQMLEAVLDERHKEIIVNAVMMAVEQAFDAEVVEVEADEPIVAEAAVLEDANMAEEAALPEVQADQSGPVQAEVINQEAMEVLKAEISEVKAQMAMMKAELKGDLSLCKMDLAELKLDQVMPSDLIFIRDELRKMKEAGAAVADINYLDKRISEQQAFIKSELVVVHSKLDEIKSSTDHLSQVLLELKEKSVSTSPDPTLAVSVPSTSHPSLTADMNAVLKELELLKSSLSAPTASQTSFIEQIKKSEELIIKHIHGAARASHEAVNEIMADFYDKKEMDLKLAKLESSIGGQIANLKSLINLDMMKRLDALGSAVYELKGKPSRGSGSSSSLQPRLPYNPGAAIYEKMIQGSQMPTDKSGIGAPSAPVDISPPPPVVSSTPVIPQLTPEGQWLQAIGDLDEDEPYPVMTPLAKPSAQPPAQPSQPKPTQSQSSHSRSSSRRH